MSEQAERAIVGYIRRDDISWWAGCRYDPTRLFETYIAETSCLTRRGARSKARRMAKAARRRRARGIIGTYDLRESR